MPFGLKSEPRPGLEVRAPAGKQFARGCSGFSIARLPERTRACASFSPATRIFAVRPLEALVLRADHPWQAEVASFVLEDELPAERAFESLGAAVPRVIAIFDMAYVLST